MPPPHILFDRVWTQAGPIGRWESLAAAADSLGSRTSVGDLARELRVVERNLRELRSASAGILELLQTAQEALVSLPRCYLDVKLKQIQKDLSCAVQEVESCQRSIDGYEEHLRRCLQLI